MTREEVWTKAVLGLVAAAAPTVRSGERLSVTGCASVADKVADEWERRFGAAEKQEGGKS